MAKYKDIKEYRTKKRVKSFIKQFILLLIVGTAIYIFVSAFQLFNGTQLNNFLGRPIDDNENSFPLTIKEEQLLGIYALGNNVSVLTKGNIINYLPSGTRNRKSPHGYTNPIVKEGNKRILTYDRGGIKFRVDTASNTIAEITTENQIISCAIADNNNVAILTNHNKYSSVITVYDSDLDEIYKYSSSDRITLIDFSTTGESLLATSIVTVDGIISSALLELDITKNETAVKTVVPNILPLESQYNEQSDMKVIGIDEIIIHHKSTNTQSVYEYKGNLLCYDDIGITNTVIVTEAIEKRNSYITIVDMNATVVANYSIEDVVKDIYADEEKIILLGRKSIYVFDINLKLVETIDLERPYSKLLVNNENLYLMGVETIERYKIKEINNTI